MDVGGLRRTLQGAVAGVACLFVAACSQQAFLETVTSPEDRALSVEIIRAVHAGKSDKISEISKQDVADELLPLIPKMRELLPLRLDREPRLVDGGITVLSSVGGGSIRRSHLAYAVDGADRHALVRFGFEREGDEVWLTGLHVNALPKPIEELTAFTLTGKPLGHYFFLTLVCLTAIMVVASLVVLIRARNVRQKWLWAVGCMIGFGQFTMDWSTGAVHFNPFAVQAFGIMALKVGALASWQIGFGLPVVAYVFLLRQAHRWMGERAVS